jgi:hypothetical protein
MAVSSSRTSHVPLVEQRPDSHVGGPRVLESPAVSAGSLGKQREARDAQSLSQDLGTREKCVVKKMRLAILL